MKKTTNMSQKLFRSLIVALVVFLITSGTGPNDARTEPEKNAKQNQKREERIRQVFEKILDELKKQGVLTPDIVYLKSGEELQCTILEESDTNVKIRYRGITATKEKDDIERIESRSPESVEAELREVALAQATKIVNEGLVRYGLEWITPEEKTERLHIADSKSEEKIQIQEETDEKTDFPSQSRHIKDKEAGTYPRLANYYHTHMDWTQIGPLEASLLAKWDLIAINHVMHKSIDSIKWIRKQNPSIRILVWISAGLHDDNCLSDPMMVENFQENWYLHYGGKSGTLEPAEQRRLAMWRSKTGDHIGYGMNPTSDWSTFLPRYVEERLMSSGLFDGVLYDCVWEMPWQPNIDIDNDGRPDRPDVVRREYQNGMARLLRLTRELLGSDAIIIGNPGVEWRDSSLYWSYANGHMQENALGRMFGSSWPKIWEIYRRNMSKSSPPERIHWIAVDTNQKEFDNIDPKLPAAELQRMRFGLSTALLGDGYFSFDEGDGFHGQLWWFPEYDANLGHAESNAVALKDGRWMRQFEKGAVVVNPTDEVKHFQFDDTYKDISTGDKSMRFAIPARDGRILVSE